MAQTVHPAVVCMFAPPVGIPMEGEALAVPQLVMLANVALTAEGGACDFGLEEKQMVELKTVGSGSYTDSEEEEEEEDEDSLLGYEFKEHGEIQTAVLHPVTPLPPAGEGEEEEDEGGEQSGRAGAGQRKRAPPGDPELAGAPPAAAKRKRGAPPPGEDLRKKKPFHCKPCQYQAESEEDFVRHIRVHGTKKLAVVAATEGEEPQGEAGPEAGAAATGEAAVHSKGVIRCERCGYNTNRYDHYLAHLKHHSKGGDSQRVYRCTICTYTTVSQYHWKKHMRNHFPSKLYTCAECCYFSDRKNNYVQHIRTHTGERPFHCPYCQYTSSQKTHLTRHMRTHSGEKPFKCDNCSYVAANQHEVTRHVRQVHGGPKPLSCPHCPYKTADRSNYKKHVELHVNPRQFLCPVCSYAASKKCNLQYHVKSRHPGSADITMDVSKVRLRVKGPEAGAGGAGRRRARSGPAAIAEEQEEQEEEPQKRGGGAGYREERRQREEEEEEEEEEDSSGPINLSIRRTGKTGSGLVAGKERREQSVPADREEALQERGGAVKGEERKTEKQRDRAAPERRKDRTGGKAAKVSGAARKGGVEKQAQAEAVQSEQGADQSGGGKRRRAERKAGRPKREQSSGAMSDAPSDPGEERSAGVAGEAEVKKEKRSGGKRKNATKKGARTERNVAMETEALPGVQGEIPEEPPKEESKSKTKVGRRKPGAVETAAPGRGEQPASATRSKRRRLEESEGAESQAPTPKRRKAERRPAGRSQKAAPEPPGVPAVEPETTGEGAEEDAGTSLCKDGSPVAEFRLVLEEEEEEEEEQTADRLQSPEGMGALAGPSSGQEEPEGAGAGAATEDCSAPQQLELADGSKGGPSPSQPARVAPGKKALPPLELPRAGSTPGDGEEDEGIHSPDGSDISDSVSEGSDDSGLNGLTGHAPNKDSPSQTEMAHAPVEESHTPSKLTSHTCIFCDRAFPVEVEYRRHLNRHLVNVYYLESAVSEEQ
ncbi:RE1-silencing transcription factor-like [Anguilla rostrata]|uniref:RE1-silencing transcription factor-like n=1 Tax=Anguilla rostrata TaxID=7938 RepID=UPI0030D0CEC0